MSQKRVVVGLSGGVDSSVAAYLLLQQGYEVIALFMRNWHDDSVIQDDECPWIEDSNDALLVAQKLGIPFQVIDLSESYKSRIVDYMFKEYEEGRTPNPDILCNREIKFDVFLDAALSLGADFVATGHYCQKSSFIKDGEEFFQLLEAVDKNKDQSYFLCQLNQKQLSKAVFPIGHLQKSEVRAIALELELVTAQKKDSQGLCFVGKIKLPDFLQQQLSVKKGKVIEIPSNSVIYNLKPKFSYHSENNQSQIEDFCQPIHHKITDGIEIGTHDGAHFFTIGQRKGLQIGGKKEPLFVLETDTKENLIFVGQGDSHPGLLRYGLKVKLKNMHWVRPDLEIKTEESMPILSRIRYRQALAKAILIRKEFEYYFIFEEEQKGISKGQFAAVYQNNELIASGVID